MVVDRETGFVVDVGDETAFAECAVRLLGDPELARQMGARGREIAEDFFRPRSVAENTFAVYQNVLSEFHKD
jgi:glycosyltransferase involved in cell wall biosynthesis